MQTFAPVALNLAVTAQWNQQSWNNHNRRSQIFVQSHAFSLDLNTAPVNVSHFLSLVSSGLVHGKGTQAGKGKCFA